MENTNQSTSGTAIASPARKSTRLERVASLKPCEMPFKTESGLRYQMVFVTMTGKQTYMDCNKAVYQKITGQKLDFHKKSDFVLTIEVSGPVPLVTHIVEQPKPDTMVGFTREEEKKAESNALVIALYSDRSMAPVSVPERVTEATIQEVMDAIGATDENILPGVKLGSYTVLEKREVVGATEIYVDPMIR